MGCGHLYRHLKYNDEDAKQDFLEWAIEEECMPSVKEVQQVSIRVTTSLSGVSCHL